MRFYFVRFRAKSRACSGIIGNYHAIPNGILGTQLASLAGFSGRGAKGERGKGENKFFALYPSAPSCLGPFMHIYASFTLK